MEKIFQLKLKNNILKNSLDKFLLREFLLEKINIYYNSTRLELL